MSSENESRLGEEAAGSETSAASVGHVDHSTTRRKRKAAGRGWGKIPWRLRDNMLGLMKGSAAKVYLSLATHQELHSGVAVVSPDRIGEETRLKRTAVYDGLLQLQRIGAIEATVVFVERGMVKGWRLCMLEEESARTDERVRQGGLK